MEKDKYALLKNQLISKRDWACIIEISIKDVKQMNKALLLAFFMISLLFISAIMTHNTGFEGGRLGSRRIFPRDLAHWFGWIGLFMFMISNSYSILKRSIPKNIRSWLRLHCITGTISLVFVALHAINRIQALRPESFVSLFAFLLMIVITITGIVGRYSRIMKEHWRILHVPLTIILYLALIYHILEKMNFL